MNIAVNSAALAAAPSVAIAAVADGEIVAAGKKFEGLFPRYIWVWFQWSRLMREAHSQTNAKFGTDYGSPAWSQPSAGESPAQAFLERATERNGAHQANELMNALHDEMEPLAELIRDTDIESLAGLRAKALVTIWDSRPIGADHDGSLTYDFEWSYRSLLAGAVAVTGLSDLFGSYVERIKADATEKEENTVAAPSVVAAAPDDTDPIFAAIDIHRRAVAAYDAHCVQQDKLEAEISSDDDPRWIAFEQGLHRLREVEIDAECELAGVVPTTIAGVLAILKYAAEREKKGIAWRDDLIDSDDEESKRGQSWYYFVHRNIVQTLEGVA